MQQRRVLIVGGGIGGLVLGRALARLGVCADLLERSEQLRGAGAGITLSANALRVLSQLGLGPALSAQGRALESASITDHTGRALSLPDLSALEERYGTSLALDRGRLHDVLATGAQEAGPDGANVNLRLGLCASAIRQSGDGVEVTLSDGSAARYHAVLGADGVRSSVRSIVFGETAPRYAGYTCWRWVGHVPGGIAAPSEMWGRGQRVGLVPLEAEQVYAYFVTNAPPGTWREPPRRQAGYLRELFSAFEADVPRVLQALGPNHTELLHGDIEEVELPAWTEGSVALLGDAAHALTPNLGQGAAMAIEDAVVLASELAAHHDAPTALLAYEKRRRARVQAVQRDSRKIGRIAQWQTPWAVGARNLALRLTPGSVITRTFEKVVSYIP